MVSVTLPCFRKAGGLSVIRLDEAVVTEASWKCRGWAATPGLNLGRNIPEVI